MNRARPASQHSLGAEGQGLDGSRRPTHQGYQFGGNRHLIIDVPRVVRQPPHGRGQQRAAAQPRCQQDIPRTYWLVENLGDGVHVPYSDLLVAAIICFCDGGHEAIP